MNTIDVNGLLSQMRALTEQTRLQPRAPAIAETSARNALPTRAAGN